MKVRWIGKKQDGSFDLEMGPGNGFSLRASERPLRNIGSDQEKLADGLWSVDLCSAGKRGRGSKVDVVRLS